MIETVWDILSDSVKDALVIFPFLFLVYTLMESIENAKSKEKLERALSGKYAPLFAAVSGVIPECGFSVMCAKLFDGGFIAFGTLIAAFIATSDEGVVILLSQKGGAEYAGLIIAFKVVYAAFLGVVINLLFGKFSVKHVCPVKDDCIECGKHNEGFFDKYVAHPFYHSAKTFIYVLAVNVFLNSVIKAIGEENVYSFISSGKGYEPVYTAVFGLIPNCASSIFLAQGFINGIISFSGLIAGLSVNSGVAMLLLFKNRKSVKRNLAVILITFISGVVIGYITFPIS